jgi:hypothetical protein
MKTTVDIADDLFQAAKRLAAQRRTTLRALIEEGLRQVISRADRPEPFTLRDAAVGGRGTQPGIQEGDWETIRDLIYGGRGS